MHEPLAVARQRLKVELCEESGYADGEEAEDKSLRANALLLAGGVGRPYRHMRG